MHRLPPLFCVLPPGLSRPIPAAMAMRRSGRHPDADQDPADLPESGLHVRGSRPLPVASGRSLRQGNAGIAAGRHGVPVAPLPAGPEALPPRARIGRGRMAAPTAWTGDRP